MGHMTRGVGNIDVVVVLQQVVINLQRIRQRIALWQCEIYAI